jgi:hypothetical protein
VPSGLVIVHTERVLSHDIVTVRITVPSGVFDICVLPAFSSFWTSGAVGSSANVVAILVNSSVPRIIIFEK